MDQSRVITPPGDTAWVYDPQHDALRFVSKADAKLYTYSLSEGAFTNSLSLGGVPGSVAISPDGQWLVIGNELASSGSTEVVTRVNLTSLAIDHVTAAGAAPGVWSIAVDAQGMAIFTVRNGFRPETLYTFPVGGSSPAVPIALPGFVSTGIGTSYLETSPDHRFILFQDTEVGPSRIALYDSTFKAEVGEYGVYLPSIDGYQSGKGDISNNGLIVDLTNDRSGPVFDQHLNRILNLGGQGQVEGAAFSQDGQELFLWVPEHGQVIALDTQTWTQIGSVSTTIDIGVHPYFAPVQSVQVVDQGRLLALNDGSKVELIDIAARFHLPIGPAAAAADPGLPISPLQTIMGARVQVAGNMDLTQLSDLLATKVTHADAEEFLAAGSGALSLSIEGANLSYANGKFVGGTISEVDFTDVRSGVATLKFAASSGAVDWPAASFQNWLAHNDGPGAFQTILAGGDDIVGGDGADLIRSYAGDDFIQGRGGADTLFGGAGNDIIWAGLDSSYPRNPTGQTFPASQTYLRGEEGADYIVGGTGFDNINGNTGADTESGGDGNDWVVGGQDNDMLFGSTGDDIVNGNLGNDTCVGEQGADTVRGGQGADAIFGGVGNDWLSGDLGNDTITGGSGADTIHAGPGIDQVTDFNAGEGDRIQLDHGVTYSAHQEGADTVVDLGGGDHLILRGVQLSALPAGWILIS